MAQEDFALQWLDRLGTKIYNKGKLILKYNGINPRYKLIPLNTHIKYGAELGDEDDLIKFTRMSYSEFERTNYMIAIDREVKMWKPRQKIAYVVRRKTENSSGITHNAFRQAGKTGIGLKIEHDAPRNRFRLVGDNVLADPSINKFSGVGPWIVYGGDVPKPFRRRAPLKIPPSDLDGILGGQRFTKKDEKANLISLEKNKDVPFMFSDEKYLVCFPYEIVPPRILVTGAPRKGKSLFGNAVTGRMFYIWEDRIGWLMDIQNQFNNISLRQDYNEFIKRIKYIGEIPRPIPAVQFYLANKNKDPIRNENISLKLALPFHEFLNKFPFYSHGIPHWKLDKAERYLRGTVRYIKDAKDLEDIRKGLFNAFPQANDEKKGEGMRSMIFKWQSTFETIFHEKFTSNLYKNDDLVTDELEVKFRDGSMIKGHPFIMAMEAGLIPVINIFGAPRTRWVRNYMADVMQKILEHQKEMKEQGRRNRLIIVADEMQEIYEEGKVKDNCSMSSERLFKQGGFQGIGYVGNTQSLDKLNSEMVKHATHIACFYTQSAKERKMIKEMFDLDKEDVDQLLNLKEQEFMIFSKEKFVIYDRWGKRKEDDRTWFKGKVIPPFNYHAPP